MKIVQVFIIGSLLALGCILFGCGSGEYDLEEHQIDYVEKTLKVDTIKKVVEEKKQEDSNKDNTSKKESFTFVVQIGAFFVKSNFDRFFSKAQQKLGQDVYFDLINNLYKIRIGKYSNKSDALKQLDNVKSQGYFDAFVLTTKN